MEDRVTEYATAVVNGEITDGIGKLHFLACKRHVDDLARQGTDEFPYVWDAKASQRAINFAETLTINEGFEQRPLHLLPCQAFDRGCTYGWKKPNGYRRFRRRYLSMARQNGKTMGNGIDGAYIGGFSGYHNGKMFTVATRKRQASLAWEETAKFIQGEPELIYDKWENPEGYFKVSGYKSTIECVTTGCTLEALSQEAGLQDGFRSIYSSIDEIHQHKSNAIYKAIYDGTRALPETLVSMITTRGKELNSFCKEMDDYAIKVLTGESSAEDFFIDIYSLDEGDDPWDERNWKKANPYLMTVPEQVEVLRQDAQTARDMGGAELSDFLTKSLNLWVDDADDQFIAPTHWDNCGGTKTLEDFRGQPCWVGLDLSSGGDLTSFAREFKDGDGFYLWSHSFMPRGRLDEHVKTDLAPYDLWRTRGLITATGGTEEYKNDYGFIVSQLEEIRERFDIKYVGIGVDPHNFDGIRERIEAIGAPVIVITQSARGLNDATVDLQLLCKSERLAYDKSNELLTWSFLNARLVQNSFGEVKVDKKPNARTRRIDPVDACVDAHACMLKLKAQEPIDVSSELDNYLTAMGWVK